MDSSRRPSEIAGTAARDRSLADERNVFCGCYDACLDEAVRRGWATWTCACCPVFALGPAVDSLERYAQTRTASAWPG